MVSSSAKGGVNGLLVSGGVGLLGAIIAGLASRSVGVAAIVGIGGVVVGLLVAHLVATGVFAADPATTPSPVREAVTTVSRAPAAIIDAPTPAPTPTSNPAPPVTFTTAYDWFLRLLLTAFLVVALYDRVQLHFAAKRVVDEMKALERR